MTEIGMIVWQRRRLRCDRIDDLRAAVPDVDAIEAGERVEAALAHAIDDIDALGARHDAVGRLAARMLSHMGRGVEEMIAIPCVQFVV